MLTIKESSDKEAVRRFLSAEGAEADPDGLVMLCEEGEEILGVGALSLRESRVYLDLLVMRHDADDISLKLGLARALLNAADLRGIKEIYGASDALEPIYKMLRFKKGSNDSNESGEYRLSLEGYFTAEH